MKYKIKDGFNVRQIAGTWVAVPTGSRAVDTSVLVTLSDTAVFLWNLLAKGLNVEEIVARITEDYEIDNETAKNEAEAFVEYLKTHNLLEE